MKRMLALIVVAVFISAAGAQTAAPQRETRREIRTEVFGPAGMDGAVIVGATAAAQTDVYGAPTTAPRVQTRREVNRRVLLPGGMGGAPIAGPATPEPRDLDEVLRELADLRAALEGVPATTPGGMGAGEAALEWWKSLLSHSQTVAELGMAEPFATARPDWSMKVYLIPSEAGFVTGLLPQALPPGSRVEMGASQGGSMFGAPEGMMGPGLGGGRNLYKHHGSSPTPSLIGVYTSPEGHEQVRKLIDDVSQTLAAVADPTGRHVPRAQPMAHNLLLQVLILAEAPAGATDLFIPDPNDPQSLGLSPRDLAFLGDRWIVEARGMIRVAMDAKVQTLVGTYPLEVQVNAPDGELIYLNIGNPLQTTLKIVPDEPVMVGSISEQRRGGRGMVVLALRAQQVD